MLGSRTDGALEEETSWPNGVWPGQRARALVCALACVVSGCSAVTALAEARRAERTLALSEARSDDSPEVVYALTLSRAYLEKSREEASEAQYGNAVVYAKASRRAAEDAQRARALRRTNAQAEVALPARVGP